MTSRLGLHATVSIYAWLLKQEGNLGQVRVPPRTRRASHWSRCGTEFGEDVFSDPASSHVSSVHGTVVAGVRAHDNVLSVVVVSACVQQ